MKLQKGDKVVITGTIKHVCTDGSLDVILDEDGRTLFNLSQELVGIVIGEEDNE